MQNFSAEFMAKKSMNYYESLSREIIREVQAEINNAAERGHFKVTLPEELLQRAQNLGTDESLQLYLVSRGFSVEGGMYPMGGVPPLTVSWGEPKND